ncbi:conserved hypothetical protein [Mucor ambiguus]|uniref:Uncharacterized protein n=1 Tax=Mucor ambiguus TaxID=91626 RepID=A0A0C9MQM0_9FUNG|nr:conserved hypothetical protein [Mucor ambiguus]
MQQGGIQLMNWFAVACELGRDWRKDVNGMAALFAKRLPSYAHIMDSFAGAQALFRKTNIEELHRPYEADTNYDTIK